LRPLSKKLKDAAAQHDLMFTGSHKPPPASELAARDTLDAEIR